MINNEEHQCEQVEDVEEEDSLTIVSNILEELITKITETEKKQKRKKKKKHRDPQKMGMGHFLQYLKGEGDGDGDEENTVVSKKTQADNVVVDTSMVTDMDVEVCHSLFYFLLVFVTGNS